MLHELLFTCMAPICRAQQIQTQAEWLVIWHPSRRMDGCRGLDNRVYYMLAPEGQYYNYSGCGNTLNTNHPAVRQFLLDCLRYWVTEMHVDGFRFDLGSILTRAHSVWQSGPAQPSSTTTAYQGGPSYAYSWPSVSTLSSSWCF